MPHLQLQLLAQWTLTAADPAARKAAHRSHATRPRLPCAACRRPLLPTPPRPPLLTRPTSPNSPTPGIFWVGSVAGTLAFQWSRPIPTSLRIIHARVYAQGLTLAALGLAAAVDVYEHKLATSQELDSVGRKLREIEAKVASK